MLAVSVDFCHLFTGLVETGKLCIPELNDDHIYFLK